MEAVAGWKPGSRRKFATRMIDELESYLKAAFAPAPRRGGVRPRAAGIDVGRDVGGNLILTGKGEEAGLEIQFVRDLQSDEELSVLFRKMDEADLGGREVLFVLVGETDPPMRAKLEKYINTLGYRAGVIEK